MRPGKLYIKILLSFLAVLFTTLLVVFVLFLSLPSNHFTTRLEEFTQKKAIIIKGVVEEKIQAAPTTDISQNGPLKEFVLNFGKIMEAKVWIQKLDGTIPLKSFEGEIPASVAGFKKKRVIQPGNITLYHQRSGDFYGVIPIVFPGGGMGTIQVLFDRQAGLPHPGKGFALGLVIIGVFAALLILPVSRIITKRLKKLRQSALTIAEGNLSHRAHIRGQDEIGDLAQAFNRMADKLETMIRSGKELTANVSHELRTPLTRIRIAEEMVREKLGKNEHQLYERHLDEIREDIQELDTLIGRILELSKLDLRDVPLIIAPFDLSELFETLLLKFKSIIDHKDLKVETRCGDVVSELTYFGLVCRAVLREIGFQGSKLPVFLMGDLGHGGLDSYPLPSNLLFSLPRSFHCLILFRTLRTERRIIVVSWVGPREWNLKEKNKG